MNNAGLRPEVITFAYAMERRLRQNDLLKGATGWRHEAPGALMQRVWEETQKLQVALVVYPRDAPNYYASIGKEAADVANMAMMVSDVCGALDIDASEERKAVDADVAFAADLARYHGAVWTAAKQGDVAIDTAGAAEVRVLIAKYRGLHALVCDQLNVLREALRLAETAAGLYTRSDDCVEIDATVTFLKGAVDAAATAAPEPYARGGYSIPSDQGVSLELHRCGAVIPLEHARAIRELGAPGRVHLEVHAMDAKGIKSFLQKNSALIASTLRAQGAAPAPAPAPEKIDTSELKDVLSLVGLDPTDVTVTAWSPEQRQLACEWAAAVHLRAGDNDVDVPPRPPFLPDPWKGPYNDTGDVFGGPTPTVF